MRVALHRSPEDPNELAGTHSGGSRVGWHLILLRVRGLRSDWIARLRMEGDAGAQEMRLVLPMRGRVFGFKLGVAFVGVRARRFGVLLRSESDAPQRARLLLLPIPPWLAVVGTWMQNRDAFTGAYGKAAGPWAARVRRGAASAAFQGQAVAADYRLWALLHDAWNSAALDAVAARLTARPTVTALVFGSDDVALAATMASVRAQAYPAESIVVVRPEATGPWRGAIAGEWVAVLQAGEVLPRQALLLLVDAVGRAPADVLLADEDRIAADGVRSAPWFKPEPGPVTMCSGLLSRGVWLVRAGVLALALEREVVPAWAECVRLAAWFSVYGAGGLARRVPRVLTHRRDDAEAAPGAVLAGVVDAGLARLGVRATVEPGFPLRLRWDGGGWAPRVSVIVPSRLNGAVQLRCLLDVLARTAYPNYEMVVVVTQRRRPDRAQRRAVRRLRAAGPVRVVWLRRGTFNYSIANNVGAGRTRGELLCLLNDDVSTLQPDWLDRMTAVFSDPVVGVVGAKLYYPDMRVQHGGVIMGLAGLADHAHRFLPQGEPGYMWRAVLDQEMSVVTGACMMVRRTVFEQAGGLDPVFPSGFNDVDFCLRVRVLGYSVVMAASVELVHHETLSFGHHYAHAPEREAADVALMRARWPKVIAADPFHNPNLSLAPLNEWALASPPRLGCESTRE